MELVYTDSGLTKQGVLRDFALDMAYGDDENDFLLTMPLPQSKRYGADRDAVITEYEGDGSITIEQANGSTLRGLEVDGKAERVVGKNLLPPFEQISIGSGRYVPVNVGANVEVTMSTTCEYFAGSANVFILSGNVTSGISTTANGVNAGSPRTVTSSSDGYVTVAYRTQSAQTSSDNQKPWEHENQLELGSVATPYEPYHPPYVEVVQGRNLLDYANPARRDGYYNVNQLIWNDFVGVNDWAVKAVKGAPYTLTFKIKDGAASGVPHIAFLDNAGTVSKLETFNTTAGVTYEKHYTAPADGSIHVGYFDGRFEWIQLERGTIATPYVPYGALEVVVRGGNIFPNLEGSGYFGASGVFTSSELTWHTGAISVEPGKTYSVSGKYVVNGTTRVHQFSSTDTGSWVRQLASFTATYDNQLAYMEFTAPSDCNFIRINWNKEKFELFRPDMYEVTRTAIDTQGNPLASLPDGTRDELTVDASGHVQLVKRVGVVDLASLAWKWGWNAAWYSDQLADAKPAPANGGTFNAMADNYQFTPYPNKGNIGFSCWPANGGESGLNRLAVCNGSSTETPTGLLYYELATPEVIDLGFIDMPATYDGYTRLTAEASTPPTFRIRYEVSPASRSYLVEIVQELEIGALVYAHGTDIGGIVDTKGFDNTGEVPVMTYSGRTWHGIMDASITRPNSGQAYLTLTGDINEAIGTLITRAGLGEVFSAAPAAGYTVSYQVPRYVSMWEALRRICKQYGMRPQIERGNGKTVLGAVAKQDYSNGSVSDLSMGLQFERYHRPVNHLVVLGQGELAARTVIDLYADEDGNISTTQTLFGSDEVAAVYENTSDGDASKLLNDGIAKLREYQRFANVDMSLPSNEDFQIGDTVTAYSVEAGLVAAAEVVKKVVTVGDNGFAVTSYELGEPAVKAYR